MATALEKSTSSTKELCSLCGTEPGDLTCSCGARFDFNCVQQHAEYIGYELQENHRKVSEKLATLNNLQSRRPPNNDAARAVIENWKQKRTRDIDDIAAQALNEFDRRENTSADVASLQATYAKLSSNLHGVVHGNLDAFIELHQQIQNKIDEFGSQSISPKDDSHLDASLLSRLNSSASSTLTNGHDSILSANDEPSTGTTNHRDLPADSNDQRPTARKGSRDLLANSNPQPSTAYTNHRHARVSFSDQQPRASSGSRDLTASAFGRELLANSNPQHSVATSNDQRPTASAGSRELTASAFGRELLANSNTQHSPASADNRDSAAAANDQRPRESSGSRDLTANAFGRELLASSNPQHSATASNDPHSIGYINHRDGTTTSNEQHPAASAGSRDLTANTFHRDLLANSNANHPSESANKQDSTRVESDRLLLRRHPPVVPEQNPPSSVKPVAELTNSTNTNYMTTDTTDQDEFEPGKTRFIQRSNPKIIRASNDTYAGTVCCHNNQVLYNNLDRTTQNSSLVFVSDIANPSTSISIEWELGDDLINTIDDDDWIQDIIYSDKLASYLVLSRARLRLFSDDTKALSEYYAFKDHKMKRLSCSEKYIYLASTQRNAAATGDEIILLNYDKTEALRKTFREIIPPRINRGANLLVGEISDLAVGSNEQIALGYRLERRNEVGVYVFNVLNDGREWSYVKQLLLNDCWHRDLSYTPRIEWSEKLNVFILIEHMTGHLIMIDKEGQVEGECRFMHAENRRESPINLSISTSDWLCVRYESSINIHKLTM